MKRTEGPDWLMWKINVDMPLALTEIDLIINGILHAYSTKSFHQMKWSISFESKN